MQLWRVSLKSLEWPPPAVLLLLASVALRYLVFFLIVCPPSTGMLFPKESGICLHLPLSSSDVFSPLSNIGGAVEMLNLGRIALSLEFMLAHVQYSPDTLRFTVFN